MCFFHATLQAISDPNSTREWTTLSPTGIASLNWLMASQPLPPSKTRATCNWGDGPRSPRQIGTWEVLPPNLQGVFKYLAVEIKISLKLKKKYGTHIVFKIKISLWISKRKLCWKVSWGQPHISWGRSRPKVPMPLRGQTPQLTASSSSNLFYLSTFSCDCVTFWCSMFFIQLVFCCQTAPNTMWILSQMHRPWIMNIPRSHLQESEMISGDRKSWTLADRNTTDSSKEWVGLWASPKHHVVESLFGTMNLLLVRNDDLEIVHCNTQHVKEEVPALEYVSIVGGGTLWSDRESVHEESYLHGSKICWWLRTMMWLGAG